MRFIKHIDLLSKIAYYLTHIKVKTGKCHSVPAVLKNGKIELSEKWAWTSGDFSKGESLPAEVQDERKV